MLQTVEQAHDKAAALGKALYSQLFLWLVAKLNTTISAPQRCSLQPGAITEDDNKYQVGPMVHTKTYLVYIFLFFLTLFGPIYYGPP